MARSQEKRFSDEELEYYGELYLSRAIREAGVDFEGFLSNPDYYLMRFPRKDGQRDGKDDGRGRKGFLHFLRLRSASRTSG